jgi:hypothetical protein
MFIFTNLYLLCIDNVHIIYRKIWYYVCYENQLDALFILNLFRQTTTACFGHTYRLSSGGIHCFFLQLVRVIPLGDCLLVRSGCLGKGPLETDLENHCTKHTTVYIL